MLEKLKNANGEKVAGVGLVALAFILVGVAFHSSSKAQTQRLERQALQCAWESEGTDQEIADCYTELGLDIPEDL